MSCDQSFYLTTRKIISNRIETKVNVYESETVVKVRQGQEETLLYTYCKEKEKKKKKTLSGITTY